MKKILSLALIAAALSGVVHAQSWQKPSTGSKQNVVTGFINSATTLTAMPVVDSSAGVALTISGTAAGSVQLQQRIASGVVLTSQTVNIYTTPTTVSFSAPLFFEGLYISPTTGLTGTNSVHAIGVFSK